VIKLVQLSNEHNNKIAVVSNSQKSKNDGKKKGTTLKPSSSNERVRPPTADVCDCADPAIALAAYGAAGLVAPTATTTFPLRAVADDRRNEDNIA
jgi:hypothetical protein